MIDDADLSRVKTEFLEQVWRLHACILTRLVETERETTMEELASGLGKWMSEFAFNNVAHLIAAFIHSEFHLRDIELHRFVFGDGQLPP